MCGYLKGGTYHAVTFHEMDCYLSGQWPDGNPFPYGLEEFIKRYHDLAYAQRAHRRDLADARRAHRIDWIFEKMLRVARRIDWIFEKILS